MLSSTLTRSAFVVFLFLVVGVAFITTNVMISFGLLPAPSREIQVSAGHVSSYATEFAYCLAQHVEGQRGAACGIAADQLLRAIEKVPKDQLAFYRKSNYEVIATEKHLLVLVKRDCSETVFAPFAWRAYPFDTSSLPKEYRSAGYISGSAEFQDSGLKVGGACVVVTKLALDTTRSFEVGQWDRGANKWIWIVGG